MNKYLLYIIFVIIFLMSAVGNSASIGKADVPVEVSAYLKTVPEGSIFMWVSGQNLQPLDENGITMPGKYIGAGSIIEPIENTEGVYFYVRIVKYYNLADPLPPGWRERAEVGDIIRICRNSTKIGTKKDYLKSVEEFISAKSPVPDDLLYEISEKDYDKVVSFWNKYPTMRDNVIGSTKQKRFNLNKTEQYNISTILMLVSLSEFGKNFLDEFLPLYIEGKIAIESVRSAKSKSIPLKYDGVIGFYFNGNLYLDFECDLLRLLPIFVHEGTHSLDLFGTEDENVLVTLLDARIELENLREELEGVPYNEDTKHEFEEFSNVDKLVSKLKKQEISIVLSTEHHAFWSQDMFIRQMAKIIPGYEDQINMRTSQKQWMGNPIDLGQFRYMMSSNYLIPYEDIENYFSYNSWDRYMESPFN